MQSRPIHVGWLLRYHGSFKNLYCSLCLSFRIVGKILDFSVLGRWELGKNPECAFRIYSCRMKLHHDLPSSKRSRKANIVSGKSIHFGASEKYHIPFINNPEMMDLVANDHESQCRNGYPVAETNTVFHHVGLIKTPE